METKKELRDFLKATKYMCLGTCDMDGNVWTAPITYVTDDEMNLYFHSALDSTHIEQIKENPEVSFSVYSSELTLAEIDGLQGKGIVGQLEDSEVEKIHQAFFEKHMPNEEIRKQFAPPVMAFLSDEVPQKRFFKLHITELYKKNLEIFQVQRRQSIDIKDFVTE